ncbi:hypothetical protein WKH56_06145 [Priestia sp. SB1]|uniref:DUF3278 domain-containing protein n=2 Tax=Priestia TaxID=2800373 RepID=A0AAX6NC96_PRIAR|nr:hypothetical protein [Priestia aryabhattai]MDU9693439.1 hypothetical protein [Priestia aryabhattai]NGY88162.1 hypothetical protein [Priestia megaterium]
MEDAKRIESTLMGSVKKIEGKIRFLLITFCSFYSLFFTKQFLAERSWEFLKSNNIFVILGLILVSFVLAKYFLAEIEEALGKELRQKSETKVDKLQKEFIYFVGIVFLFFFTQVGITAFFFSDFENLMLFNTIKLYPVLFTINSIIIYVIYRLTILKLN